jgi:hypothetical protein
LTNKLQQAPSSIVPDNPTTVNQYGEKNVHVGHAENINNTVNFNVTYMIRHPGQRPVQVTQTLNRDYYNLFVIGGEEFYNDHFLVPKDRALVQGTLADDLFDRLSALTPDAIKEIKTFPALFASENTDYWGKTDTQQQTIYGLVTDIKVQDNGIKIYFQPFTNINQQTINNIAFELGIGNRTAITELNRTHWTIKRINLIEALTDAGISVMAPTI